MDLNWKKIMFGIALFTFINLFLYAANADMGIGIKSTSLDLYIKEGGSGCVGYLIYNPGTEKIIGHVEAVREIKYIQTSISPNDFLIESCEFCKSNEEKFANSVNVQVCFSAPMFRDVSFQMLGYNLTVPLPFYPKDYKGSVTATSRGAQIVGGSSAGVVVSSPLTVHVGNMQNFYNFIYAVVAIIIVIIIIVFRYRIYSLLLTITGKTEEKKILKAKMLEEKIKKMKKEKERLEGGTNEKQ